MATGNENDDVYVAIWFCRSRVATGIENDDVYVAIWFGGPREASSALNMQIVELSSDGAKDDAI